MRADTFQTRCCGAVGYQAAIGMILIALATGIHAETMAQATAAQIPALLQQQGWQSRSDENGNTIYHPPQPIDASDSAPAAAPPGGEQPDIEQLLLERGWRIDTGTQGETLLVPDPRPDQAEIDRLLRQRGWRMLRDVSGNIFLMPTATAGVTHSGSAASAQPDHPQPTTGPATRPPTSNPAARFRQALREKGWLVTSRPDGSMLVYPPAYLAQEQDSRRADKTDEYGFCEGVVLAGEEIPVRVDAEDGATRLAGAWIAHHGYASDAVGKAHKIEDIFLVSIVESTPPHALRNLLVVRKDGRISALY